VEKSVKDESALLPKLYSLPLNARLRTIQDYVGLESDALKGFQSGGGLTPELADHMIENVVGTYALPLGIAVNFQINGREFMVPMAIEEPSVVAGASYMAKLVGMSGGFIADADDSLMIAQIQILDISDLSKIESQILENKTEILEEAKLVDPVLVNLGGGPKDLEVRPFPNTPVGPMIIVHLIIDTVDAMGANAANSIAERVTPTLEKITGGRAHLRILSNLADKRLARASCKIPADLLAFDEFSGDQVRDGVIEAWAFAEVDPYRAATHNKGIMNGVDAVLIATGNDWRAIEAGAHAYASRSGRYKSLSKWRLGPDGELEGWLEMPLAVGTVGGATRVHPTAKSSLRLLGIEKANELMEVVVSVGLAQNLAALRALATEGIQRGHMSLHARQVAIAAGAKGNRIEDVADQMVRDGTITVEHAEDMIMKINSEQIENSQEVEE
jgi:hydroxymethylglutaryl-CoA reductase